MTVALSINHGTPLGGQTLTITGLVIPTGFTVSGVSIEGRAATVSQVNTSSVVVVTPVRTNADNSIVDTVSVVDVVVSYSDDTSLTIPASYTYYVTRWDLSLQVIRTAIANISKANGYNYDITASQVYNFQVDQSSSTGASYPQVIVYGGPVKYDEAGQDSPYGFYTGTMHCFVQAVIPLSVITNWDLELRLLQADLFRAVMLARNTDAIALNYGITDAYPGRVNDASSGGALGVATIELDITLKHIMTNMNSVTQGE